MSFRLSVGTVHHRAFLKNNFLVLCNPLHLIPGFVHIHPRPSWFTAHYRSFNFLPSIVFLHFWPSSNFKVILICCNIRFLLVVRMNIVLRFFLIPLDTSQCMMTSEAIKLPISATASLCWQINFVNPACTLKQPCPSGITSHFLTRLMLSLSLIACVGAISPFHLAVAWNKIPLISSCLL